MTVKTKQKDSTVSSSELKSPTNPSNLIAENTPDETKEIKVIERIIESKEVAPQDIFGQLNRQQIDLMKRTIAKGASDDELRLFLQVCKGSNLNPFLKQVFLVPRWDSKEGKEVRVIQVSIDGLRAIAEEGGMYAGNQDPIFEGEQEVALEKKKIKAPNKATVTVYKIVAGQKCEFTATARWEEYYPGAKMGFQWHVRPYLMLGKCAEALALRKGFPKLLSGMYSQEELDKGNTPISDQEKNVNRFAKLKTMIENATKEELLEYDQKLKVSKKYTPEEKEQFKIMIKERIENIK